ncbi:hypothetical protein BGZ83_009905 [Gryganskiella cystojenkinii]|nr:hypothetical protein BGZ83_009905 [Gryganskiella cystojenkinii]
MSTQANNSITTASNGNNTPIMNSNTIDINTNACSNLQNPELVDPRLVEAKKRVNVEKRKFRPLARHYNQLLAERDKALDEQAYQAQGRVMRHPYSWTTKQETELRTTKAMLDQEVARFRQTLTYLQSKAGEKASVGILNENDSNINTMIDRSQTEAKTCQENTEDDFKTLQSTDEAVNNLEVQMMRYRTLFIKRNEALKSELNWRRQLHIYPSVWTDAKRHELDQALIAVLKQMIQVDKVSSELDHVWTVIFKEERDARNAVKEILISLQKK